MIEYTARKISDSVTVVEVSGMLKESNRSDFFKCISEMIEAGSQFIVIECHRLGYLNSGALASLLAARKRTAKSGGQIYLTHVNSSIAEVLEITKLGRLLSVFPTTADALENIRTSPACMY